MANKPNNTNVENITALSQYDNGQVLRDAHSLPGHYLRVKESNVLVADFFDYFTAIYNDDNQPTQVCYYAGIQPHLTTIVFNNDVSGNLAGTYFLISSGRKGRSFAVVYTVNGSGAIPSIPDVENIIVDIIPDEVSNIICVATAIALRPYNLYFNVVRQNSVLEITTVHLGITNDTIDTGATGFTIVNSAGQSSLVAKINLTYSAEGNPIWQGQELVDHIYNIHSTSFDIEREEITVSAILDAAPLISKDPEIFNVSMAVANNEYSQVLPVDTKRFQISIRDSLSKFTIGYTPSGTIFTVERGVVYSEENLKLEVTNNTIYFTAPKSNLVAEIIIWK